MCKSERLLCRVRASARQSGTASCHDLAAPDIDHCDKRGCARGLTFKPQRAMLDMRACAALRGVDTSSRRTMECAAFLLCLFLLSFPSACLAGCYTPEVEDPFQYPLPGEVYLHLFEVDPSCCFRETLTIANGIISKHVVHKEMKHMYDLPS